MSQIKNKPWYETTISMTDGARETDPFRSMLRGEWWAVFDAENPSSKKDNQRIATKLHHALNQIARRSAAMDAAPEHDDLATEYLCSLRHYFTTLQPGEAVRVAVVRPLLRAIMQNLNP